MAEPERIMTLHPQGKQGVRIEKSKYDAMVAALLEVLPTEEPGVRFTELEELLVPHLAEDVYTADVSVSWYLTTIKLDLEARGMIARLKGSPQRLVKSLGR